MEYKLENGCSDISGKISYSEINYILPTNKSPCYNGSSVEEPSVYILRHSICSDKTASCYQIPVIILYISVNFSSPDVKVLSKHTLQHPC